MWKHDPYFAQMVASIQWKLFPCPVGPWSASTLPSTTPLLDSFQSVFFAKGQQQATDPATTATVVLNRVITEAVLDPATTRTVVLDLAPPQPSTMKVALPRAMEVPLLSTPDDVLLGPDPVPEVVPVPVQMVPVTGMVPKVVPVPIAPVSEVPVPMAPDFEAVPEPVHASPVPESSLSLFPSWLLYLRGLQSLLLSRPMLRQFLHQLGLSYRPGFQIGSALTAGHLPSP